MEESRELAFETAAETDLFQYFVTEQQARQSVVDTTLSAFAQLAALRLNTARALISLVDRTSQHILIEATQNSSLVPHSSREHGEHRLLFGRATFPRSQGLCGYALDVLSPEKAGLYQRALRQSPLVVKDVARDDHFKHCDFATSHPSVRFYAAVPINTKSGFSIGTLSVMADEPREGLIDTETDLLTDLANAIAAHLEMTKSNEGHRRSEKMIKGLGAFMQDRIDLGDWWLELGNNNPRHLQEPEEVTLHKNSPTQSPSSVPGNVAEANYSELSPSLDDRFRITTAIPVGPQVDADYPVDAPSVPTALGAAKSRGHEIPPHRSTSQTTTATNAALHMSSTGQSARTITPDFHASLISKRLKEMFSRACHIIQECIEVDGAIFLDASITALSGHPAEPSASPAHNQGLEEKPCGVLGLGTGENSSLHGEMASNLKPLTEVFLQSLFQKYPQGHVFSRDEHRQLVSDTIDSTRPLSRDEAAATSDSTKRTNPHSEEAPQSAEEKALLQMLPDTRSIAFIPLWDSHRERWFAGSFMWTVDRTTRVLTHSEDLHYLAAFGNCIMAEVARLDVVGADRAKSDFISSISHELRSPLHGILASVELLQDTTVDLFQHAMIDTIERCGRTLLDTIQHVLDFAKINHFTSFTVEGRTKGRPGLPRSSSGMPSLCVDVDLSLLVEDVVDSVFAGHEFQGNSSLVVTDEASGYPPEGLRRSNGIIKEDSTTRIQHTSKKARIDVVMDIGWRPNWVFSTQSGALRRILMNLFGNALKYTESGWVKVSLQAEDIKSAPSQPQRSVITISVRDTGRGISQDYFHSGLFTPFTQEDSMNSGTGLGLSIVLQIVRSLGGTIDITSEQGVGTEVVVTLTLNQAPPADPPSPHKETATIIQNAKTMTSGLTIGLVGLDESAGTLGRRADDNEREAEPALFLQASIQGTVTGWFDMKVAAPSTFKSSPPDILIANENSDFRGRFDGVPVIVLCSHESLFREYAQSRARGGQHIDQELVHFVSKPCGPHKLAKAFAYCLDKKLPQESPSGVPSPTLASPQSLIVKSPEERAYYMSDEYFHAGMMSPAAESAPDDLDDAVPKKQKPMLLLVEDNEINLQLLSTFVKKSNYEYHTAENGLLALQAVQNAQTPYDVIFMDISMPVMDGLASAREIRKYERGRGQKPCTIIALTGLGSADSQNDAFSSGMDLFLTKPVRLSHLRKILSEWTPTPPDVLEGGDLNV
ncbi:hypothetical protein CONLIGDRAFT_718019 [Coniochaeta ligniaria NRRL 30616]|uniref:histidine kinase n=1 Tax=Coniochaeta ligniaria NRRL 30616 TaxID=1408157 RepID=A0A1J7J5N7_9PEZI|nr:hypothetical protein CONLIGDRAFT_718019 [Coniochaeta ligniaria NRRL 30616]